MQHLAEALKPLVSDLASTILFAIVLAVTHNVFLATGLGIALGIAQVTWLKLSGREIMLMQWMSLGLVVVFGSLTLYFHDARFVMVKFTIGHVAIGIAMLKPGWMSRYLPQIVRETLSERAMIGYSAMWPVMMFALAAANLYIGFTMSQAAWTWFLATVPAAAPWVLLALQYVMIRLHVRSIIRGRATPAPAE
jgi:intracellular septation protein A